MKFKRRSIEIEAYLWNKNDNSEEILKGDGIVFLREGTLVRFFGHPSMMEEKLCRHCGRLLCEHWWINSVRGEFVVCPGDMILSEQGNISKGFYGDYILIRPY